MAGHRVIDTLRQGTVGTLILGGVGGSIYALFQTFPAEVIFAVVVLGALGLFFVAVFLFIAIIIGQLVEDAIETRRRRRRDL
jgi:hypothetical protein